MQSKSPISEGDIFWIQPGAIAGLPAGVAHPYVVVKVNAANHDKADMMVVCALTSNIKRASWPGNVLLEVGEANLPRLSVVEVSKLSSVGKDQLGDYIGSLTEQRIKQIFSGMRLLQSSYYVDGRHESIGGSDEQQPGIGIGDD